MRHVPVLVELDARVAAAGHDGVGGGEPGVEDGVELAVAADAGLALHPDEVGGRVDGRREEVLRRADAELDQVLPASGHHRGGGGGGGGGPAPPVRRGRRAAAAAGARHDDTRAVEAALHGAADEVVAREVGVHAGQLEAHRRREHREGEEEQEQEHQQQLHVHGGRGYAARARARRLVLVCGMCPVLDGERGRVDKRRRLGFGFLGPGHTKEVVWQRRAG